MNTDSNSSRRATSLKHGQLTEKIIEVFYEVYNELGHGFLESVYRGAMEIGLRQSGLRVSREYPIAVWFRGEDVGDFRANLMVEELVLLELTTAEAISKSHEAQLYNYLRATPVEVGLLLNFGHSPSFRRIVFDKEKKKIRVHPRSSAVGI
jgi:GxxExxY protein